MFTLSEVDLNTPQTLGQRIRMLRGSTSQAEFSIPLGISQNTLSRYEKDLRTPDAVFIDKLCKLHKISADWLMTGQEPMQTNAGSQPEPHASFPSAESPCERCLKLEKRLEILEDERRELSAENRQLLKEISEFKLSALKLAHQLDTARRMCSEYEAAIKAAGVTSPIFGEKAISQFNDCK